MPEDCLRRCFCEVEPDLLERLARRRYMEGASTMELVCGAATRDEKDAACCVGLLELPEDLLAGALGREGEGARHVKVCRREVKARLREAGVEIP